MLINFTNHPSDCWPEKELTEASRYGGVADYPFPAVSAAAAPDEVHLLARDCANALVRMRPTAVLCQGEFSLAYEVIQLLQKQNIPVLTACSERKTVELQNPDGTVRKESVFDFVRFREYYKNE